MLINIRFLARVVVIVIHGYAVVVLLSCRSMVASKLHRSSVGDGAGESFIVYSMV